MIVFKQPLHEVCELLINFWSFQQSPTKRVESSKSMLSVIGKKRPRVSEGERTHLAIVTISKKLVVHDLQEEMILNR